MTAPGTAPAEGTGAGNATEATSDAERAIAADIEQTREELGRTVEQLAAKADVKARARQAVADLRGRVTEAVPEQVTGTAQAAAAKARRYWVQLAAAAAAVALATVVVRKLRR